MNRYKQIINKVFFLLCLCLIMSLSLGIGYKNDEEKSKIYQNIFIENIDVGKLNREDARRTLQKKYKLEPIKIKFENRQWSIDTSSINLYYDFDKAINNAYSYTRGESIKDNIKKKISLQFNETYNISLNTYYNESKLSEEIDKICNEIDISVVEASIKINENSEIIITESTDGREVDIIKLKEIIYELIDKKNIKEINLPVNIIKPIISTPDVKSIDTVLGQYSTSFNNYTSRGNNIYIAGKDSSEMLLMPGDVFSFNQATGARTWSKGYKSAKVIVGGKFVDGEGGGVCQVSTTIFNAALLAGMDIQEVHNHTYPSRYAPRGRDAAVSYGYTDLKFKNPYSHPIYIKNIVTNGAITSKIYGCKEDREKLYIKTEENYNKDKVNVKTFRIYLGDENNKIREELILEGKYNLN